ncbi:MAG: 50S ribosomal protein L21 [Victivallales bacterium]|nr:50S ribosomal protein L21 [Victivallales bacterium]
MYAVIQTGGKQYKVVQDEVIDIELLQGEVGSTVTFDQVLAVGEEGGELKVGAEVGKAQVQGEIVEFFRGPKLVAFKMKRRKGYRNTRGHRQNLCSVKITAINA